MEHVLCGEGCGGTGMTTSLTLTPSEVAVLGYYRALVKRDDGEFCRSLKTVAEACGVTVKTVQRCNRRFMFLGILLWAPGNSASRRGDASRGQANQYHLNLSGFYGFDV